MLQSTATVLRMISQDVTLSNTCYTSKLLQRLETSTCNMGFDATRADFSPNIQVYQAQLNLHSTGIGGFVYEVSVCNLQVVN